jgi:hypothetical protein
MIKYSQEWFLKQVVKNKEPKGYLLWVDDVRPVPNNYIGDYYLIIARSYDAAIKELNRFRYDVICLDHDLGEEKTGYDICKYIIENRISCNEFRIHTSNPVGRQNMTQLLSRYTGAIIKQC